MKTAALLQAIRESFGSHPLPRSTQWRDVGLAPALRPGESGRIYDHRQHGIRVISSRVVAEYPDGDGAGPQDHVSVSCRGHRPSEKQLQLALAAFGMAGTEEDNHHPGIARHFWRPVDPARRVDCECKETEQTVVDGSYRWTNPTEGPCRGCELERLTGRRCPIHAPATP